MSKLSSQNRLPSAYHHTHTNPFPQLQQLRGQGMNGGPVSSPAAVPAWPEVSARFAARVNLLANSLTSRLRHGGSVTSGAAGEGRVVWCGHGGTTTGSHGTQNSPACRLRSERSQCGVAGQRGEGRPQPAARRSARDGPRGAHPGASRPPVLSPRWPGPDHVNKSGRQSATDSQDPAAMTPQGQQVKVTKDNNVTHAFSTPSAWGGGGGGGEGHVTWVKNRSGIFQVADKYQRGRQTLSGDRPRAARSAVSVRYQTVTLCSPGSSVSSQSSQPAASSVKNRSSSHAVLRVSWKPPADHPDDAADGQTADRKTAVKGEGPRVAGGGAPARMGSSSAGSVSSSSKRLHSHTHTPLPMPSTRSRHRVPCIGVRWKLPASAPHPHPHHPNLRHHHHTAPGSSSPRASPSSSSGSSSPSSTHSLPVGPTAPSTTHTLHRDRGRVWSVPSRGPGKKSMTSQGAGQRDVTSQKAGQRSVMSKRPRKTQHHYSVPGGRPRVPGSQKVPTVPAMEELMESRWKQWHPALK